VARPLKKSLYIDALALVPKRKSGVGLTVEHTFEKLAELEELKDWRIYLVVPLGKSKYLKPYLKKPNVKVKVIWLPARVIEVLMRARLLPPVDWFLGQGVYIFPNYRNWPVWRSRSLTYVYDTSFIKYPQTVQLKNQKYLTKYIKLWMGRTDKIVTISEQVKSEIERLLGVHYAKIDVVPCGVDSSVFFKRKPGEVDETRKRYGITFKKYLLYVGNIEPRKNLDALLDAYGQLPAGLQKEYGLVIVGGGGWLNDTFFTKLEAMRAKGLQVMKVDKFVEDRDLPAIYSGAELLIHPAIYEGFGITPLEAMACGTAVAVSDLPVIKEVVGEAGAYFDPNYAPSITRAIVTALKDQAATEKRIRAGLRQAEELSWEQSAATLYQAVDREFSHGPHARPLLKRVADIYRRADRLIIMLLGGKGQPPYKPLPASEITELRVNIYDDFLKEQPSRTQVVGLKLYLGIRHFSAHAARKVFYRVRTLK
jgi:glycosyltransferase involved in cell wall biosynthesis